MKHQVGHKLRLGICMICFALLGVSFLLMPIEGSASVQKYIPILLGTVFWLSLLGGIASYICFAAGIKRCAASKQRRRAKIGLICFFKNRYAVIADVTMFVSLVALVAMLLLTNGTGYSCYLFAALFVWSFSMHCVCNGGAFSGWLQHNQDGSHKKNSCTKGR